MNRSTNEWAPLCQYGRQCQPNSQNDSRSDFFDITFDKVFRQDFQFGNTQTTCEIKARIFNFPLTSNAKNAMFMCNRWPPLTYSGPKRKIAYLVKHFACGIIAGYYSSLAAGEYSPHSPEAFGKFLLDNMGPGGVIAKEMQDLVLRQGSNRGQYKIIFRRKRNESNKDFEDADLLQFDRFFLYAGDGGWYTSPKHWSVFIKRGNEFVLFDHNPESSSHRPDGELYNSGGFVLNKRNTLAQWDIQKMIPDGRRYIESTAAWMRIYGRIK